MITKKIVDKAVSDLGMMKFFPTDPGVRASVGEMLIDLCGDDARIQWLVKRAAVLYSEWPGAKELRACYCSKYRPSDGGPEPESEVYPGGIPSESGRLENAPAPKLIPGPDQARLLAAAVKRLPEASTESLVDLEAAITRTRQKIRESLLAIDHSRKRIAEELPDLPVTKPITQADIDAARAARRQ